MASTNRFSEQRAIPGSFSVSVQERHSPNLDDSQQCKGIFRPDSTEYAKAGWHG